MKVAVIIQGRYSDQRVLGVVPVEEVPDAESLQKNDMRFEIHTVGEFTMIPEGYIPYGVILKPNGVTVNVWETEYGEFLRRHNHGGEWTHHKTGMYRVVLATSGEHAVKIVHEEWAQRLATYGSLVAPEQEVKPIDAAMDQYGKKQQG